MPKKGHFAERVAQTITQWTGSSLAFLLAAGTIVLWLLAGPFFGFSDTWQLVINTSTTIVTFLMVFLIQRAQNKDIQSLHLKLNELVAALGGASNRLINVEDLSEDEINTLHRHYQKLTDLARCEQDIARSHSVEEADSRHEQKKKQYSTRRQRRAKKVVEKT